MLIRPRRRSLRAGREASEEDPVGLEADLEAVEAFLADPAGRWASTSSCSRSSIRMEIRNSMLRSEKRRGNFWPRKAAIGGADSADFGGRIRSRPNQVRSSRRRM